jgi:heat-inducible transcriptional repressor
MVSERGLDVLRAIVHDYVASREPVGSKAIVDRHQFGVSAATIRNDMALLEEEELIVAPHTSSGRIPTDKGYRLFVDTLNEQRALTNSQRHAIERFLGEASDLDDILSRTVRLLSQLTNQVAVVQYPSFRRAIVKHLELIAVGDNRVLCVLIAANGLVEQGIARLPVASVNEEWLVGVRDRIRGVIVGHDFSAAQHAVDQLSDNSHTWASEQECDVVKSITAVVAEQLKTNHGERLAMAGTANLVKTEVDFSQSVSPLLEAIEEQVTLVKLFSELAADEQVRASIGRENDQYGLPETAIVSGTYESSSESSSRIAVVGSMRMDYAGNIAAVRAVARYLSKTLGDESHSSEIQR